MKTRARKLHLILQENRELIRGERGGLYYIDDEGNRVYAIQSENKPREKRPSRRTFNVPRGAFARYLENQNSIQ